MNNGGDKPAGGPGERPAEAEREPFLARWSRRKADARETAAAPKPDAGPPPAPPIDPASLPPIDSLTAESDFSVFLRERVPEGLRKAALEKLWRTEPSVVNYVPLVEYNWDFNAPGYGALKATDDVVKLARHLLGEAERQADQPDVPAKPEQTTEAPEAPPPAVDPPVTAAGVPTGETAPDSPSPATPPRRRHGGALPM